MGGVVVYYLWFRFMSFRLKDSLLLQLLLQMAANPKQLGSIPVRKPITDISTYRTLAAAAAAAAAVAAAAADDDDENDNDEDEDEDRAGFASGSGA